MPNPSRIARGALRAAGSAVLVAVAARSIHAQTRESPQPCPSCAEWNAPQRPFHVYGNTYFVGTHGLSAVLITSPRGHVLIDGGTAESAPIIMGHIRELGFRVDDVKLILNSHDHYDHAGGIAALQRASGATVAARAPSAAVLEAGHSGTDDPQFGVINDFAPVAHVRVVKDGEVVHARPLALTAHATGGHTPGGTTWSWQSCEQGRCLDMVYADSQTPVSADGFFYTRSTTYPTGVSDFERGFDTLEHLRCDILLTPHPSASNLWERLAARDSGNAQALIDPEACRRYAAAGRAALARRIERERGTTAAAPSSQPRWLATWIAPQAPAAARPRGDSADATPTYTDRTLREIVHTSIGGEQARLRISNEYGDQPLVIDAAHIAVRDTGAAIVPSTDRTVTFGGRATLVLRPGATAVSDAVTLPVPATSDLAVSLHLAEPARIATRHGLAMQRHYVSATGNFSGAPVFAPDTTLYVCPFLAGVDVVDPAANGVIVTLGNSITDGARSTSNANARWPDVLARRLLASSEPPKGVANAGISGNRVLTFGTGPSALARFDRDVLLVPGVTHVILLEGINDIRAGINTPRDAITADDLIFGYRQLIARAHERGLVIIGATLTPAVGAERHPPANEAMRQAVNQWIRTSGAFDGVIDFDAVTRDPAHPDRLLPAYDSGDHLHPSDAGYRAMGEAIDLALFRRGALTR